MWTLLCLCAMPTEKIIIYAKRSLPAQVQSLLDAIRDTLVQMLSACLTKYVLDVYMPVRANMRPVPALVSPKKTGDTKSYRRMHAESAWTSMENALASAQSLSAVLNVHADPRQCVCYVYM